MFSISLFIQRRHSRTVTATTVVLHLNVEPKQFTDMNIRLSIFIVSKHTQQSAVTPVEYSEEDYFLQVCDFCTSAAFVLKKILYSFTIKEFFSVC